MFLNKIFLNKLESNCNILHLTTKHTTYQLTIQIYTFITLSNSYLNHTYQLTSHKFIRNTNHITNIKALSQLLQKLICTYTIHIKVQTNLNISKQSIIPEKKKLNIVTMTKSYSHLDNLLSKLVSITFITCLIKLRFLISLFSKES